MKGSANKFQLNHSLHIKLSDPVAYPAKLSCQNATVHKTDVGKFCLRVVGGKCITEHAHASYKYYVLVFSLRVFSWLKNR